MYSQPVPVQTTYDFLKQQRTMNFQNYLKLKREEKAAVKRYHAAVKIQAVFRGWLVRCNFKLIIAAAIKMQALWRRALVRKVYTVLFEERRQKRYQEMLNKAATKIQAAWKGYGSRKNRFNFKTYKELQLKNLALQESIDRINELEEAISDISHISDEEQVESSTSIIASSNDSSMSSLNAKSKSKSLNKSLTGSMEELATMSPSRIAELLTHAIESSNDSIPKSQSIRKKSFPGKKFSSVRSANMSQELSKELVEVRDSILDMFPNIPSSVNLVRPDVEQVELLQKGIRLLRQNIQQRELDKMAKVHYLMRTAAIPGVYSDIYSNELTEIEKQLKALKFWKHGKKDSGAGIKPQSQSQIGPFIPEDEPKGLYRRKSRKSTGPVSQGSGSKLSQGGNDELNFDPNNPYTTDEYTNYYTVKPGRQSSVAMTTPPTTGHFSEISDT